MLNFTVGALANRRHLTLGIIAQLTLFGCLLAALGLNTSQFLLNFAGNSGNIGVTLRLQLTLFTVVCRLQVRQILVTSLLVYARDHVGGEVDNLFQVFRRQIKQIAQA